MTLKTLKTKTNISLILDDEFIQFCKLNKIEDIEKTARETFKRGFDLLKYGNIPTGELTRQDKEKLRSEGIKPLTEGKTKTNVKEYPDGIPQKKGPPPPPPKIVEAIPMKSSDAKEVFEQMGVKPGKKEEKNDLYDE